MIPVAPGFPSVTIIVPTAGLARYVRFEHALQALEVPTRYQYHRSVSANLAGSVNDAIDESRTDYYWIVDDDHDFPPRMLLRLMAHEVPVVVPLTTSSRAPFWPVIFRDQIETGDYDYPAGFDDQVRQIARLMRDGYEIQAKQLIMRLVERGPQRRPVKKFASIPWRMLDGLSGLVTLTDIWPNASVGRAGMLIQRWVLEAIGRPYFTLGQMNPEEVGDDTHFCERVRQAGIPIHVDLEQSNGHMSPVTAFAERSPEDQRWGIRLVWENGFTMLMPRAPELMEGVKEGKEGSDPEGVKGLCAVEGVKAAHHDCREGYVCALHLDEPAAHKLDDGPCPGAPVVCRWIGCEFWQEGVKGSDLDRKA